MNSRNRAFFFKLLITIFIFSILHSCHSAERRFESYMDSVSIADSIYFLKLKKDEVKTDTTHFRENSLFNFPFLLNEKRNWFHHARIGKHLTIHADDFQTDSLKALTPEEYSRIIHDPNEKNYSAAYSEGTWFYYSIEDTSNEAYWTFTLIHYRKETDFDLFLVFMKADGTFSDNLNVASCSEEEETFEGIPARFRCSSKMISKTKMESDDYFELANYEYEPGKRTAGKNFLATITHYHFKFTISADGKIIQQKMTTKENPIYARSEWEERLFK